MDATGKFQPNTPGVFDMPFSEYKAAPGVNKSLLDKFRVCPLLAYEYEQGLLSDKQTEAMLIGSLTDSAVFDPFDFRRTYHRQPLTYVNPKGDELPWSGNATACKAWKAEHQDKPIIDAATETQIERIVEAVWSEKQAAELLRGAKKQQSMFVNEPNTGLLLKGRPDATNTKCLIDLKKVRNASNDALSRAIDQYYWYVQAAFYHDIADFLGLDFPDFYFIAVEDSERPKVNVRRLKLGAIEKGRWVYQKDLARYAACKEDGIWPGYCDEGGIGEIDVPAYTEAKIKGGLETLELTIGGETYAP